MGVEIERKFLVVDNTWRQATTHSVEMRQGYLSSSPACSIRVRREGSHAALNIKSATLGIERLEFEYPIATADADAMLDALCDGKSLFKTRYYIQHDGMTWELDVFHGDNDGLVVAEIELDDAGQGFNKPAWAGAEVSDDPRYYNVCLIDKPYSSW